MQQTQGVFFSIRQEEYAIDIEYVERIIAYSKPTPVPEVSDYVLGLLPHQEGVFPLVDLNKRFHDHFLEFDEKSKILIIALEEYKMGLVVDEVKGVQTIDSTTIEEASEIVNGILPEYIKGVIKEEDDIVILLQAERLFVGDKKEELIEIIQEH